MIKGVIVPATKLSIITVAYLIVPHLTLIACLRRLLADNAVINICWLFNIRRNMDHCAHLHVSFITIVLFVTIFRGVTVVLLGVNGTQPSLAAVSTGRTAGHLHRLVITFRAAIQVDESATVGEVPSASLPAGRSVSILTAWHGENFTPYETLV